MTIYITITLACLLFRISSVLYALSSIICPNLYNPKRFHVNLAVVMLVTDIDTGRTNDLSVIY